MTTPGWSAPIAVLGGGGWGTALAVHLAGLGKQVRLWGRNRELLTRMRERRENEIYLPGIRFPESLDPVTDLSRAVARSACIVLAVPSHGTREVVRRVSGLMDARAVLVSATKGIEEGSLLRMSEVISDELGASPPVAVLSGPSFAAELARELPTAVSVASRDAGTVEAVQREFRSRSFRLYGTEDVVGVEVGGAMKNVIAIAAGVVDALGLGHNARSALITRGLAEISRLAEALGGRRDTLAGLSGLGDLVLTCTGAQSRNRRVGLELGQGKPLEQILEDMHEVAEGVRTTGAALALGARHGVELPIAAQMADVIHGRCEPREAVEALMLRRQRSEVEETR